jgi:short-subunit dehydrogenase
MFSSTPLTGARTILTGASSGIGWALAKQMARAGARVVVASRNQDRLAELASSIGASGGEAWSVPTDVTDPAQRTALLERALAVLGGLDILVNNAGAGAMGYFALASEERLRRVFEVDFFACTELTRLALPLLRAGNQPMVVNVGSVIGRRGIPGCSEYCAAKFALAGWSESLRAELAQHGVHVLLVSPGAIETGFHQNLLDDQLRFGWQQRGGMSADRCAAIIMRALRRRPNEVTITAGGKLLVWLNRLVPRAVDAIMVRLARPDRLADRRAVPSE